MAGGNSLFAERWRVGSAVLLMVIAGATIAVIVPSRSAGAGGDESAVRSRSAVPRAGKSPTYAGEIAQLLYSNCADCHRPGEVAPFSLLTYEDARKRSKQIADVVSRRLMPPWKADSHGEFLDERRLSKDQVASVVAWAGAGAPSGNLKEAPAVPAFLKGWRAGKPDKAIGLAEPFSVGAEGRDQYQCFVIPFGVDKDQYVSMIEVRPGNARIVHHVIAYLDTSGAARKLDEKDPGPGYSTNGGGPGFLPSGFLGGWAPGNDPKRLPTGVAHFLPKNADIVLEIHYNKSGKPETDQTSLGLHYASEPISKRVRFLPVINPFFRIPAGASNHPVDAMMPVFQNISIHNITPHMHLLGKDVKVTATKADGTTVPMINIPDWDFNWQLTYVYKQPVKLASGSRLSLTAHYDNSTSNPKNPNTSPRDVTWGEQTRDEMCIAFLAYTVDSENLLDPKQQAEDAQPARRGGLFRQFIEAARGSGKGS